MGDPVKIVERETTHAASFSQPTVCRYTAFLLCWKNSPQVIQFISYTKRHQTVEENMAEGPGSSVRSFCQMCWTFLGFTACFDLEFKEV